MVRKISWAALLVGAIAVLPAVTSASHFRGAAMVPQVSSSGLLTITSTSFWRPTFVGYGEVAPSVSGVGSASLQSQVVDFSDPRFAVLTTVHTIQLPSAGNYNISASSCCRVAPGSTGNYFESSWEMNSGIVWDGASGNNPIAFNFASVQSQVNRAAAYSDNLDAASPQGYTLSYNQALNTNITSQPTTNFNINPSTGLMTIVAGETPQVLDNNAGNVGADKAFSGNIVSSDGSFVEFDWMFDGVDGTPTVNLAPNVDDESTFGIVGTLFNYLFAISDPEGETLGSGLSFDAALFGILGPTPAIMPIFNNLTGQFEWDSTGSALGTYIFQVRGRDSGNLTDVGSLTVDLVQVAPPDGAVPEPAQIVVWSILATCGIGVSYRFRRA